MSTSNLYVGLISGTSVDGVDCVLVDFSDSAPRIVSTYFQPSPSKLRDDVLKMCSGNPVSPADFGTLDNQIGTFFAEATNTLLELSGTSPSEVAALGSHGQTVWHQPNSEHPFSLQLGDPNRIAHDTGITTVADFRRMDMAAGGQGAPLAPLLHQHVFHCPNTDRAVVNIGGISNITCLPANESSLAFDTGPGNVLMDYWINKHHGKRFDEDGLWAGTGEVNKLLLDRLLKEPYLALAHPKSTGRELFNGNWLEAVIEEFSEVPATDVQATLVEFTASSIVSAITKIMQPSALYVCGGGAHNGVLMASLGNKLAGCNVTTTEALGIHPDWVEATAFAWMARETMAGRKINTGPFTGAKKAVILGGIYSA